MSRASTAPTPPVLGVDGWKGAWVAARVAGRGVTAVVTWRHGRFADLLDQDLAVVAVDIPVGLAVAGRRGCDFAARAVLGRAASRVFLVPPRYALEAATHGEANALLRAAGEPAVSVQTWGLRAAILEVDACSEDPRVVEVHPEVSLVHLAGRVLAPKKTARGVAERLAALAPWVDVVAALSSAPLRVPVDDAIDALVAAWTAQRVAAGQDVAYPAEAPTPGDRGRPMLIHA